MARLPVPGSDEGQWGQLLNDFLLQAHASDGTLKTDVVGAASIQDNSISSVKVQNGSINSDKLSLSGGSDSNILTKNATAAGGLEWSIVPSGQIYPLEGYGFHSASVSPETTSGSSFFNGWQTRVWVPAYKTITKAATFVTTAATGAATFVGFAVYSDDGQTLLGQGVDTSLFLTTGLPEVSLASPIAAQSSGHFVQVLVTSNYSGSAPNCPFSVDGGPASGIVWNSGPAIRSAYFNGISSFPATIDPATGTGLSGWTATNYMPVILLG